MPLLPTSQYPRISIITPSYNQGHFIEETIRSVVSQGYPNLEYIIIDGGSTDNTVEVIKRYESQITYWVSEPDRGQTHAINKGLAIATGDILAYINSDDYYRPNTLFRVAEYFSNHPETDLLHGRCCYVNEQGEKIGEQLGNIQSLEEILDLWDIWWKKRQFVQPEVFWTKQIAERVGEFAETLHYVMDYDYWCRILQAGCQVGCIDQELSCFRFTTTQKSNHSEKVAQELLELVQPLLWSSATSLRFKKRLELQGKWLYQARLMPQIAASTESGDSVPLRWLKSIQLIFQHPQLLFSPGFQHRVSQSVLNFRKPSLDKN
jgi:glycosyltransferase involved in cell wall biosynthesis